MRRIVPAQRLDQRVSLLDRVLELLLDHPAEVEVEPEIRAAIVLRLRRLVVPLQQALRIRERAVLLGVRSSGQEEDLGRDLLGLELARLDLRAVVPERRGLDLDQIAHDEPVELREAEPVRLRVRVADGGVLAREDVPLHLAVEHLQRRPVRRVVVVDPRQLLEEPVVLLVRVIAEVRLHQAHPVRLEVSPEAGRRDVRLHEVLEVAVGLGVGHRQIPREDVVERRDVRRALNRRVTA